ncbi:hypothetical protein [Klebsiella oxytoca]|uniref:hypothetical protein n=1 Tax=Klebsiella oxytoca TaxID=571 RepID=UPI00157A2BC8|nr:hypothetical protein [Klebsiella oxytoca]
MTTAKAGKLLAKALNNTSREESLTAFGMAFTYAQRGGFALSSLHRIEIVETQSTGISSEREAELVEKYNRTLKRAKELTVELEKKKVIHDSLLQAAQDFERWLKASKAENVTLANQLEEATVSAQAVMDLNKELTADLAAMEALKSDSLYYEELYLAASRELSHAKHDADKVYSESMSKLESERLENREIRLKNQTLARDFDVKGREVVRLTRDLEVERHRHGETTKELHHTRERERMQVEAHASELTAANQQIEALNRELAEARAPGFFRNLFN